MGWTKGAVVIVKHGDDAIADAIEKGMDIQTYSKKEVKEMERENTFLKKRSVESLTKAIQDAENDYGYNWTPPKWAEWIISIWAFCTYHICTFIEKYLSL